MVEGRHGGNYRAAFDHYDSNRDGKLNLSDIQMALKAAGLSPLVRSVAARTVVRKLDLNEDGLVEWADFLVFLTAPE